MIYTAQTDISLTCRSFSLNIIKLSTCSEITQVCQCLYGQVRYRQHLPEYQDLYHTPKSLNRDNTQKFSLLVPDEGMF